MKNGKTLIRLNNKIRGCVEGNTFYSERTKKHFFVKYNGFGCSVKILASLQQMEVENFAVKFLYEGLVNLYKCKIVDFYNHGISFIDKSEGYEDLQLILPMKHWIGKEVSEVQGVLV